MTPETQRIHGDVEAIGKALGFETRREVADSLLALRLDSSYRPRIDLMWSLPLRQRQARAIGWALGADFKKITHLPVVGIEVEGSAPTTKTMEADVANLMALGVPLGLLVVSEAGEKNIYRRAARVVRIVRRAYGDIPVVPVEASWLTGMSGKSWKKSRATPPSDRGNEPRGGETKKWSHTTRQMLRRKGEEAGFVVVEPYVPPVLGLTWKLLAGRRAKLMHTTDPQAGMRVEMRTAADYLTSSEIDLAWLMPLPQSLQAFVQVLAGKDPSLREHAIAFPELWSHVPVAGFELESAAGKHAGGALLNLAAYSVIGILATPTDTAAKRLKGTLCTYQHTLGLRNVFVRSLP